MSALFPRHQAECLPNHHTPAAMPVRAMNADHIAAVQVTVYSTDPAVTLRNIAAADLSEREARAQTLLSVRNLLEKLGTLEIAEVCHVVDTLRAQCDGDSSVLLQECGEALEEECRGVEAVLRKIDSVEV